MKRKQWSFSAAGFGIAAFTAIAAMGTNWRPLEMRQPEQAVKPGNPASLTGPGNAPAPGSTKLTSLESGVEAAAISKASTGKGAHSGGAVRPNIKLLERQLRQQWARAHPDEARKPAPPGSYREVAHLVEPHNWDGLRPVHRAMVRRIMLQARQGVYGAAPCFAPGTNLKIVRTFEGITNSLGFFRSGGYWTTTAAGPHTQGTPVTIRWSVVPDGTAITGANGEPSVASNLKARLNSLYGDEATWRPLLRQVFANWAAVSGVRYVEEPNDDGSIIDPVVSLPGQAGVRGDVRIGGHLIDGNSGILAYNYYPNHGDMVIDTADNTFDNLSNSSRVLRNVLAHEHGHGLGFAHVCPINQTKLMEPFLATGFDGPQLDDIQNAQRGYGDPLEENDTQGVGTDLGDLPNGTHTQSTRSIDSSTDQDFYQFSITGSKTLTASLRPLGGSYAEGPQDYQGNCGGGTTVNAGAQRDLQLTVFDNSGSVVNQVNATGAGSNETLPSTFLSAANGPYAVRVSGNNADLLQLYTLDLTLVSATSQADLVLGGAPVVVDSGGNGNNNGRPDAGETSVALTIPLRNIGSQAATNVTGTLVSLTPGVTVVQANAGYPNIGAGDSANNTTQPTISISSGFVCGNPINLRLDIQSTQISDSVSFSLVTGTPGAPVTTAYTGSSVAIPDNGPGTVDVPLAVTGGVVTDINVGLESITHNWVGDLTISLISPSGRQIVIVDRLADGENDENNFTNTVLDDEAAQSIQTAGSVVGGAPFTGSFKPANPLSLFDGENATGTWKLRVTDALMPDPGFVNAFSLRISSAECAAPLVGNQPPVNQFNGSATFPGAGTPQTINEDAELVFNTTNANRITVTDPDAGTDAVQATLTVANGTLSTGSNPVGLTITGNGTATLVLNGTMSNINTALNGLRYIPNANYSGTDTLTILTDDLGHTGPGGAATDSDDVTISITPVNDAPTLDAIADPATIDENSGLQTINLSGITAGGGETQTLTVTVGSSNTGLIPNPTVTYTSPDTTGTLSYTPVAGQTGSAVITVTVTDNGSTANGGVDTTVRTFTVTVTAPGANKAPTLDAIPDPTPIFEDAAAQTINLSGISAGAGETQNLTITATSSNPSLIPDPTVTYNSPDATGSLSYTPVADQFGSATITVTVTDDGGTAGGGVNTTTRTFTVVVTPVNDAPTLSPISDMTIPESSGAQTVNLSGISAGPANESGQTPLTVTATSSNPALISHPTVTYTSPNPTGSLSFTPAANQIGLVTITVTVTDSGGTANGGVSSFTRTFNVQVGIINNAPSFTKGADQVVAEDSGLNTVPNWATNIDANDSGQVVSFLVTNDNNALFSVQPAVASNGTLTFTPAPDASGTATVTVRAKDNGGTTSGGVDTSAPQTFIITVTPVNDAPVAQNQNVGTAEEQAVSIVLTASDVDNASLAYSIVTQPAHGTVAGVAPNMVYTPSADFTGTDSFTFRATDGSLNSNVATVSIVVGGTNDAPVAVNDVATTTEDTPLDIDVALNDTDIDGDTLRAVRAATTELAHGTVSVNANGTLRYVPDANFHGTATFAYTVSDGALESSATVTVTVTSVNDAPVALNDSYTVTENSLTIVAPGVLGNDSDVEGDALTSGIAMNPTNGTVIVNQNGSFTYTPAFGFNGIDSFTYRVSDGTAHSTAVVTLTVRRTAVDATSPTVVISAPINGARIVRFPVLAGVVRDNVGGSGIRQVLAFLRRSSDGKYWNGRTWGAQTALETTLAGTPTQSIFRVKAAVPTGANALPGVYFLSVVAFDKANNRGNAAASFRVLDVTAPLVAITSPRHGATATRVTEVRGTLTDEALGSGPASVLLTIRRSSDGRYWTGRLWSTTAATLRTTLAGSGRIVTWARTTELPPALSSGQDIYVITAVGYDRSGNRSARTIAVRIVAAGTRSPAGSNVALSNAAARLTTHTITLAFNAPLDAASLNDISHYAVSNGEQSVAVESISYDAAAGTVVLGLAADAIDAGDVLDVAWTNLRDANGAPVQGSAQVTVR